LSPPEHKPSDWDSRRAAGGLGLPGKGYRTVPSGFCFEDGGASFAGELKQFLGAGSQLTALAGSLRLTYECYRQCRALDPNVPSNVSVFAGRVADTGRDPLAMMAAAVELLKVAPASELIWASPRELLNIFHADSIGCHVITVTNDILRKLSLVGKNLDEYSLETVKMFADDAIGAGFKL